MPTPPIRRRKDPSSAFKGWGPRNMRRAEEAEQRLTDARQELAHATRRRLRRPAIDVFALPAESQAVSVEHQQTCTRTDPLRWSERIAQFGRRSATPHRKD